MQLSIEEKLACLYECVYQIGQLEEYLFKYDRRGICITMDAIIREIMREKDPYFSRSNIGEFLIFEVFATFAQYKPNEVDYNAHWFPLTIEGMSDRILVLLAMADELEPQKLTTK